MGKGKKSEGTWNIGRWSD